MHPKFIKITATQLRFFLSLSPFMLDPHTGHLLLTPEFSLTSATTLGDLQQHFSGNQLHHKWTQAAVETYWLDGLTADDLAVDLMLYFRRGQLNMVEIFLSDPMVPKQPEAEDMAMHQRWLAQKTGGESRFNWGTISMETDRKSGFESLTLRYK